MYTAPEALQICSWSIFDLELSSRSLTVSRGQNLKAIGMPSWKLLCQTIFPKFHAI